MRSFLVAAIATAITAGTASSVSAAGPDRPVDRLQAFGIAVAISGDQVLVGEPIGASAPGGVVHIYHRAGSAWVQAGDITVDGLAAGSGFGQALAVDGRTMLVGMRGDSARGGVWSFSRGNNGEWASNGAIAASPEASDQFGFAIALSDGGNRAFVGAPNAGEGGAVHVYQRTASGWVRTGTLPAEGLAAGDGFGTAISVDGDRVAVAAPGHSSAKGMVFVFRSTSDGSWQQEAALEGRRAPTNGRMGSSLLLKGDQVYAGAPNANGFTGMVVGFSRNGEDWSESASYAPYELGASRFGISLAMVDGQLWIGAPFSDRREGRIFRVMLDSDGNSQGMVKLSSDSIGAGSAFGSVIEVAGSMAAIGMPRDAGGEGTVVFLSRDASGDWKTTGSVFPAPNEIAAVTGKEARCGGDGKVDGFQCSNTSLLAFLPISKLGGRRGTEVNDNWGWTDPASGREYALVGRSDGTSFVDVSDPVNPHYLGNLPLSDGANPSVWRDIKVYKNHAYVVSDGSGNHGMQVFDLTRLRDVRTPQTFTEDAHYDKIGSAHNIVIDTATGYAYAVGVSSGGETCGGGLHMIDIRQPEKPTFAGCFSDPRTGKAGTGYTHDAQCLVYNGPDKKYTGHEICIGSNETAISIADVTDKANPKALSWASYPDVAYAHQGWFTTDQRYFFLGDELDEGAGVGLAGKGTRTMIWDLSDLEDPVLVKQFVGPTVATDHNMYVKGNRLYQTNYEAGLRILDISDPTSPREVGHLDTTPDRTTTSMSGTWSNYPFFQSGTIVVSSIGEGLFLVKDRTQAVP